MEVIEELVNRLEDVIENASKVPFTNKVSVDPEEIYNIIQEIRLKFPTEFRQSRMVLEERTKILMEAQKEAELLRKENDVLMNKLVEEHEITKKAKEMAEEIIEEAKHTSKEMRFGAVEYADEILSHIEKIIIESDENFKKQTQSMYSFLGNVVENTKSLIDAQVEKNQQFFNENLDIIHDNRQELRGK